MLDIIMIYKSIIKVHRFLYSYQNQCDLKKNIVFIKFNFRLIIVISNFSIPFVYLLFKEKSIYYLLQRYVSVRLSIIF